MKRLTPLLLPRLAPMATGHSISQGEKGAASISDFTLHSIGVLSAANRSNSSGRFCRNNTLPQFSILSLGDGGYLQLGGAHTRHGLDFDDAYQFLVARENKLAIATQDKNFQRVRNLADVRLLCNQPQRDFSPAQRVK
jgi:uncharacterized protein